MLTQLVELTCESERHKKKKGASPGGCRLFIGRREVKLKGYSPVLISRTLCNCLVTPINHLHFEN